MQNLNLQQVDLNLLASLEVLLEECNVTKAAQRLNISQPSMSRKFSRLKELFNDPLLIRNSGGYVKTPRAEWLQVQLREPLDVIRGTLSAPTFDPATESGFFRIATLDYGEVVLVPKLAELLSEIAPGAHLELVQRQMYSAYEVEEHSADVSIGVRPNKANNHCIVEPLMKDRYVCVMGKDHPLASQKLTLESYMDYGHSIISSFTDQLTNNERALRSLGLKRQIARKSPNFIAAHYSLNKTQLLLTSTARIARELADWQDLVVKELPFEMEPVTICLIWHVRNNDIPRQKWFRDQIRKAVELLPKVEKFD